MVTTKPSTILCIVGPTGIGKSRTAVLLAKKLNGEIVSCDSMQIYREMNIGTAKPTLKEQSKIAHHMIDICSVSQSYSVYQYQKKALKVISEIVNKKKKMPIIVGGTGLYLKALLEGLDELPKANESFRKDLQKEIKQFGLALLYQRLRKIDPIKAQKIKPADEKRIIRALEVHAFSKTPDKIPQKIKSVHDLGLVPMVFGLRMERKQLYEIIERRVDKMMRQGLAAEVRHILKGKVSKTARHALGYKELAFLKASKKISLTEEKEKIREAVLLIKRNTRRYAKRQYTWFKRTKDIRWIDCDQRDHPRNFVPIILNSLK